MGRRFGDGKKEKKLRAKEKFLRWILGVDWKTAGYIVQEKMKLDKLRGRAARRAWNFEKGLGERKGGKLAKECLEEI